MKVVLSYDYELFFGLQPGSVEQCLFIPTDALCKVAVSYGARLTFFVDAGFLWRMKQVGTTERIVMQQYDQVVSHLCSLRQNGHELQLHVHPHWEDTFWDGQNWVMRLERYRLQDFAIEEAQQIVSKYLAELCEATGARPIAYRGGGWVTQPFSHIAGSLAREGICIDSSVFKGGYSSSRPQIFDYREAPESEWWTFSDDPLRPDPEGKFLEIPISSVLVSPIFFWRYAITRLMSQARDRPFGNGSAAENRESVRRKLLSYSWTVASLDGFKSALTLSMLEEAKGSRKQLFVAMGHPKAQTVGSLDSLRRLLSNVSAEEVWTYEDVAEAQTKGTLQ
jgi:hypothetical protein